MSGLTPIGRRKFLQALATTPVAAPLVAKQAAEDMVAQLTNLDFSPVNHGPDLPGRSDGGYSETAKKVRNFLMLGGRQRLLAHLYSDNKYVGALDADLAVLKAPSLSAKIAWQRQRNVLKRLDELQKGVYNWEALDKLLDGVVDLKP